MRKYTKIIAGVFCAAMLFAVSAIADTTAKVGTVAQVKSATSTSLFNANEYGVSVSTGYIVDRSAPFQNDYSQNLTAGAFYFPSRYLGFEANVPIYQTRGLAVDEVQAGALLRLPLGSNILLVKNLAPYAGLGGVYNWNTTQDWAYIAKAGVEFRINKGWGIFAEGQYRNNDITWNKGETSVQAGIHFLF